MVRRSPGLAPMGRRGLRQSQTAQTTPRPPEPSPCRDQIDASQVDGRREFFRGCRPRRAAEREQWEPCPKHKRVDVYPDQVKFARRSLG